MIVIAPALVLSLLQAEFSDDNPVLLYENEVTVGNVISTDIITQTTTVEDPLYPTINMANPSTGGKNYFQQLTAGQSIEFVVTLTGDIEVDCLALAGHNLGDGLRILQVFAATTATAGVPNYSAVTQDVIVATNQPLMFRFVPDFYVAVKFVMTATLTTDKVRAAVLFVGKLTVFERKVQASFTPITYGRMRTVTAGRSESGQFLGRNVIGEMVESSCNIAFMTPAWYREELDDFVNASATQTFFFAWAPVTYPLEVGYAWLTDDAIPEIHETYPELMRITFAMQGIVE